MSTSFLAHQQHLFRLSLANLSIADHQRIDGWRGNERGGRFGGVRRVEVADRPGMTAASTITAVIREHEEEEEGPSILREPREFRSILKPSTPVVKPNVPHLLSYKSRLYNKQYRMRPSNLPQAQPGNLLLLSRQNDATTQRMLEDDGRSVRTATTHPSSGPSLHVKFDNVYIRDYYMELGDHPGVAIGAPVGIGWEYAERAPQGVDFYELEKRRQRGASVSRKQYIFRMLLNYYERRDILLHLGYSERDISKAAHAARQVKRQRFISQCLVPVSPIEEAFCSLRRKVGRFVKRRRQTRAARQIQAEDDEGTSQPSL